MQTPVLRDEKPFIERGSEITCPNCKKFIAKFKFDIGPDAKLKSEFLDGPNIKPGNPAKCFDCGMPWVNTATGQIHLKQGWYPKI